MQRFAAVILGMICLWLCAATAPAAGPTSRRSPPPLRRIQFARWDVLLNDIGLDAIHQIDSQPVKFSGKGFQGAIYDAAMLRGAVVQAKQTGGLVGISSNMFIWRGGNELVMPMTSYIQCRPAGDPAITLRGNITGMQNADLPGNNSVHLQLSFPDIQFDLLDANKRSTVDAGPLQFNGNLVSGEAVGMLADYVGQTGIYHHLIVWEVMNVNALRWVRYLARFDDANWWINNGPDGLTAAINVALVWNNRIQPTTQPESDKWQQKLEDGKVISMVGICRMDRWQLCWWDPEGNPVRVDSFVPLARIDEGTVWAHWIVRGPHTLWATQSPTGHYSTPVEIPESDYISQSSFPANDGKLLVGIPVGPWEKLGTIKPREQLYVAGQRFRFFSARQNGDQGVTAVFGPTDVNHQRGEQVTLTAVTQDGTEYDANNTRQWYRWGIRPSDTLQFPGLKLEQIKQFNMWGRKIQWATFDVLAKPPIPPKERVTRAEVAAATRRAQS